MLLSVFLACAVSGCGAPDNQYLSSSNELPPADSSHVEFDGTTWTRVMDWNFSEGWFPGGWGWGEWKLENGVLAGDDPDGHIAVYFFPFAHGDNALVETKVRLVESIEDHNVEAQLLTRDAKGVHSESGMVIYADESRADVRHMVRTTEYIHQPFATDSPIERGRWYTMRFVFRNGTIDAFLDGEHVFSSAEAASEGSLLDTTGVYPVDYYTEPHLAVKHGVAEFQYVRILVDESQPQIAGPAAAGIGVGRPKMGGRHWLLDVMLWLFIFVIFLVCLYIARHYAFTLNRLFGRQRRPYLDVDSATWPEVTVIVPAHNEEVVIAEILDALLEVDYERDKLTILPINDRSEDKTGEIIDGFVKDNPDRIRPFHRKKGTAGKAAALNEALERVETEIVLVFDADYVPGTGLIKQLVAPFFDPEVGAVMGRVVPYNVECNLLTRLLDLERSGGYQVDQQARMNMKMVPQYGGTVGGVRKSALLSVGGWREDSLAEDTDATYRLLLGGWKTVYQNRSECYEQVPENWSTRLRQIMRWARGHNQATTQYSWALLRNHRTRWIEKLDGVLLLGVYLMSPILVLGWLLGTALWYAGEPRASLMLILLVTSYSTLGNFAVFYEITAAAQIDGSRERIRLLPFVFLGFLVSLFSVSRATFSNNGNGNGGISLNGDVVWDKTERTNTFSNHKNGPNGNRDDENLVRSEQ
jgi:cellulose synthase/poly-beta-1,6-N-acetylglucosamine synthase-like glycosyltransferase